MAEAKLSLPPKDDEAARLRKYQQDRKAKKHLREAALAELSESELTVKLLADVEVLKAICPSVFSKVPKSLDDWTADHGKKLKGKHNLNFNLQDLLMLVRIVKATKTGTAASPVLYWRTLVALKVWPRVSA